MFTVFDLETTGFDPTQNEVVQFSYATFGDDNLLTKAENLYFYYEGMSWSEEAEEIHHIPQSYLAQFGDKFKENLIRMWTVLSGSNVIGHNSVKFDCPFATTWLSRFGLSDLRFGVLQDTMLAFKPMTKRGRISLINLCNMNMITPDAITRLSSLWFGEDAYSAHNAAYDTTATAMLTMLGMRKGYISFDVNLATSCDYSNINMDLMDEEDDTLVICPEVNNVLFTIEKDGTLVVHKFDPDTAMYPRDTYMHDGNAVTYPNTLLQVDDGIFVYEDKSATYTLRITDIGDMFTVKTSLAEMSTPSLPLKDFVSAVTREESSNV